MQPDVDEENSRLMYAAEQTSWHSPAGFFHEPFSLPFFFALCSVLSQ